MIKTKVICGVSGALLIAFAFMPLVWNIFNIGNVVLLIMAAFAFIFPWLLKMSKEIKWVKRGTILVYGGFAIVFICLSAAMIYRAYFNKPPSTGKQTVVVLGAGLVGDQPARMLARRLNKAAEYLKINPDATCIVTGGQGADEIIPEALAMKNYLVKKGIEEDRIVMEDKSVNTRTNLRYALPFIPEDSQGVVIVSDNFHQQRAYITAKKLGMEPIYNISSRAPIGLIPAYWMRDLPGIPLTWFEEVVLNKA